MAPQEFRGVHYATGKPVCVRVEGGLITDVRSLPDPERSDDLPFLGPGLVDLQVNGYAGHDFNQLPLREQALHGAAARLLEVGVTSFCPTVITNSDDAIASALAAIDSACNQDALVRNTVAGIHLEGPFISPEDGPRGAHDRRHVRGPDIGALRRWHDAASGRIRIITLSPEWPGSPAFIEACVDLGMVVSIGHTAATPRQIDDAVRAGVTLSTHLGNGAHLMLPRHPNYLWEQLAQDGLRATLIADGFHVPDQFLKVAMRAKGAGAMLVSDTVALAGMPPGRYTAGVGGEVILTPEGRLHLADNDRLLAGSALPLIKSIEHLVNRGLAPLRDAWDMASTRPAALLRLPRGLSPGAPADLVLFRRDGNTLRIERVHKATLAAQ